MFDEPHSSRSRAPAPVVGGFSTWPVSRRELAEMMVEDCMAAREMGEAWVPKLVFSSNGQGIALAGHDPDFASTMEQADIIHADGMSVVLASRLTNTPLPERVATTDFFHDAAEAALSAGLKFFILGASEAQNAAAVEAMQRLYPGLQIVGRHHGYFDDAQSEEICRMVVESGADVLWIAMGKPLQENWSLRYRESLRGVGWIKTCGGLYSYLTGDVSRAPVWMQKAGLEWAYRGMNDPRRLGWRYLTTNPYATYRLFRYTHDGAADARPPEMTN